MLTLKTNTTANDPENNIPYLEKDYAIVRGVTKLLADISHPAGLDGNDYTSASIPAGTAIQNMVDGGQAGGFMTATPAGIDTGAVQLPADNGIRFPVAELGIKRNDNIDRYVMIIWAAIEKSGFPNSSNNYFLLMGDTNTTSDNYGRSDGTFNSQSESAQLQGIGFNFLGGSMSLSEDAENSIFDSGMRQLAFTWEKLTATTARYSFYLDGDFVESIDRTVTIYTDETRGGDWFSVGDTGAFNQEANENLTFGRLNLADLTSKPEMSVADYIERDWNHARGFFGL